VVLDEAGFMLQPLRRRTWAPRGQTPVQLVSTGHFRRLAVIGAVALAPQQQRLSFYFQFAPESIRTEHVVDFLRQLHRQLRRKIIVVWDRLNAHRSAASWFQTHRPEWFEFEWFPPYSPELNPVEQCWSHTKYHDLANYCPNDLDDLKTHVRQSLRRKRTNCKLLKSSFTHAGLAL
jgi:transposase